LRGPEKDRGTENFPGEGGREGQRKRFREVEMGEGEVAPRGRGRMVHYGWHPPGKKCERCRTRRGT